MHQEPRCVQHVSLDRVCRPTLRFPPQGSPGRVPLLPRYYQSATTSCRPSHRTSLPSLGGTSVALVAFAPRRTSAPPRPGVGHPVTPAGNLRGDGRISQVPGQPRLSVCTCSSTPAGMLAPDQYGAATWPPMGEQQRLLRRVFRRSIAWLSDSLSTLRSTGYPDTTQDSLPAAGQALPDGLSTRRVPMKGFRSASLHLILLSQALLGTTAPTPPAAKAAKSISSKTPRRRGCNAHKNSTRSGPGTTARAPVAVVG
jgi:hypothetical protein